jgi:transcriptional regulator with XRE-family HTH domain
MPHPDIQSLARSAATMDKKLYTRQQAILLQLLRESRQEAGLRQQDVADLIKEPQSFVSKYESGERRLDILELREICQALGVSLADFAARLEASLQR